MPAINNDHKWEMSGKGAGVACQSPPTRSLPSSPPRIKHLEKMSLSEMLGEYHQDELKGDLLMTSSLPSYPQLHFRATGEVMEMTNDLLDLTKPLPWDRLKRGTSTMSLDSLNENYMESVPGELAMLEDQDKTPVATCTCGKTTNFECWVHRLPFGGARELTEEISQTCLELVKELRSEPSGCDGVVYESSNDINKNKPYDFGESEYSSPTNHFRISVDTPCSWKRERVFSGDQLGVDFDTPSSKSSGSLASASSVQRSELSSSPDSYDLLYKSFEVAVEMDRLQLERGQSEGSSVGSSLESLNRTSPKFQKVLGQKRRSSPDGSVKSPVDIASCDSITSCNKNWILSPGLECKPQPVTVDTYQYVDTSLEDSHPVEDASQKVTFASLAKKKKKAEVVTPAPRTVPSEATHWTELVTSAPPKEVPNPLPHLTPVSSSKPEVGNKPKRPHSLPIQLRHIQKPSSRPQQTPEQSQGVAGGAAVGVKGVTRTLSAPEGFGCNFSRSAGSGQDSSLSKTTCTSWVLPTFSQSTSGLSLLTRKRHYNSHSFIAPQHDASANCEENGNSKMAAGSPLINSSIHGGVHGTRDFSYNLNFGENAQMPERATRPRILAMDINANFTEPQEQDTFIPEHHNFIPQETESETVDQREILASTNLAFGSLLQDRLHFRPNVGAESSSDWVPGPKSSWLDVSRRKMMPPRTLDFMQEEVGPLQDKELQTCSRGCSTDSPPAVNPTSLLKMHLNIHKEDDLKTKEQAKECRDIGVSTDESLCGVFQKGNSICPCAKNCCHVADTSQSTGVQNTHSDTPDKSVPDPEDHAEGKGILRIIEDGSADAIKEAVPCKNFKGGSELDKQTSEKKTASVRESKSRKKNKPKERKGKDIAHKDNCIETSIKSWRVGKKGRRGSRTIVTCEESHVADALTNRVVRIQNVGASTLPSSADKKYIRHQPLKPIRQVDEEHRQRKVLQKLYGNANQLVAPLPPTVTAWPDSMHSRAERVHSLPANLSQYRASQSQSTVNQVNQSSQPPPGHLFSVGEPIKRILSWDSGAVRRDSYDFQSKANGSNLKQRPLRLDVSSQYDVGTDCLPPQDMHVSPREVEDEVDLVQKKALVTSIEGAVEHILSHFSKARTKTLEEKGRMGSTAHSPDIGHLMLHYLCPAIRGLLQDGLRPHVTSFFVGRLKTTLWGVVEATTQLGPGTRPLHELVRHLSQQTYLKTSDLRVNAFIMGLLNIRCLELWLEHIRDHPDIVRSLYEPNAFLSLCNGATKVFFDQLLVAVQPLTLLPFDLDSKFEHQGLVRQLNQQREKQQLMERYASKANNAVLTQTHASVRAGWLRGTASLLWGNREWTQNPEEPAASGAVTSSSLGFLTNLKGQRSVERTKNSRSSEQPVAGMWKTDEKATPTQGVGQTRDSVINKDSEAASNWSLDWIKGFVAASKEATTTNEGVSSNKTMLSSGSTWSRFGSSFSKAFERIRPESTASTTQQKSTHQHESPNRMPMKETTLSGQAMSPKNLASPTSPVTPGSPVKARCHHVTMSQEELSFTKGSILMVKQQVDPDWLMCSQGNQSGLVHIDYVQGME